MNHRKTTLATLIAASLLLSACSTINPYQRSAALDNDLTKPKPLAPGELPPEVDLTAYAEGLDDALRDLNSQRLEWFDSLSSHARTAALSSLTTYAFTAWGLYQGLKPGFIDNGVATESTRRNVAKAGIGAGSSYAIGNMFLNGKHDETYVGGFKALSCLMARARPYLLKESEYRQLSYAAKLRDMDSPAPHHLALAKQRDASMAQRIVELDRLVLRLRFEHSLLRSDGKTFEGRVLNEAEHALLQARKTLQSSQQLRGRIATASFQLRRQGDLIVAAVSEELRRNNAGLVAPEQFLKNLMAVTGKFQAVPPVPDAEGEEKQPIDNGEEPTGEAGATSGASAAATTTEAKLPAAVVQQVAEINKRLDALLVAVDPKAAQALAKKAERAAEARAASDKKIAALRGENKAQQVVIDEMRRARRGDGAFEMVAQQTADLYALRRVVNQFLVNHYDAAQRVRSIPECRAGAAASITVSPSDDREVQRGGNYRFQIVGAKGVPSVSLQGDAGTAPDKQRSLLVTVEGATVLVDVIIGSDAPAGELHLMINDAAGQATEEIVLTVPKAKKPA